MAQTNDLWSNMLLRATKNPRMLASLLGIANPESYTTSQEQDDLEQQKEALLNLVVGATKPFAKGANILAQGYGDLYRGVSGNTDYVSPFESYIKSGITQDEMGQINENPYKEILKSGVGMASRLAPFATGGVFTGPGTAGTRAFDFMNVSRNPLVNQASQMALRGTVEGGMAGFGDSENGNELRDTLTGAGIGAGSELLAGYLTNPQFRQLLNENVSQGSKMLGSKLRGYGQDVNYSDLLNGGNVEVSAQNPFSSLLDQADDVDPKIDALRDRAFQTLKLPPGAEEQLNAVYSNANGSNNSYLNDIELFQRSSVKSPEMGEYLWALRENGIVEPSFVDMSLKDYGIDTKQFGKYQQLLGSDENNLTNLQDFPAEIVGGNFPEDVQPLGNTVPKNTKMIRDHMNTTGMPDPTDDPDAYKELLKTYKDRGILPDGAVRQPEVNLMQEAKKYKSEDDFINGLRQKPQEVKQQIINDLEAVNNQKYEDFTKDSNIKQLWHGTNEDIDSFKLTEGGRTGPLGDKRTVKNQAIFLSEDKDLANFYGKNRTDVKGGDVKIMEVAPNLKNTLDMTKNMDSDIKKKALEIIEDWDGVKRSSIPVKYQNWLIDKPEFVNLLKEKGYDSVRFNEGARLKSEIGNLNNKENITVAVFDPKNLMIKKPSSSLLSDIWKRATGR